MTVTSMLRNGYRKDADGNYSKIVSCPRNASGIANHYVERVVRSADGKLLRTERMNKRRQNQQG